MVLGLLIQVASNQCKIVIQKYYSDCCMLVAGIILRGYERILSRTRTGTIRIQPQKKLVAKFEMGTRACAILVLGEVPMLVREVSFNLELSALNLRERKSC